MNPDLDKEEEMQVEIPIQDGAQEEGDILVSLGTIETEEKVEELGDTSTVIELKIKPESDQDLTVRLPASSSEDKEVSDVESVAISLDGFDPPYRCYKCGTKRRVASAPDLDEVAASCNYCENCCISHGIACPIHAVQIGTSRMPNTAFYQTIKDNWGLFAEPFPSSVLLREALSKIRQKGQHMGLTVPIVVSTTFYHATKEAASFQEPVLKPADPDTEIQDTLIPRGGVSVFKAVPIRIGVSEAYPLVIRVTNLDSNISYVRIADVVNLVPKLGARDLAEFFDAFVENHNSSRSEAASSGGGNVAPELDGLLELPQEIADWLINVTVWLCERRKQGVYSVATCCVCRKPDNDDQMIVCDSCSGGFHIYCLDPPLDSIPEGEWFCSLCKADRVRKERSYQGENVGAGPLALRPVTSDDLPYISNTEDLWISFSTLMAALESPFPKEPSPFRKHFDTQTSSASVERILPCLLADSACTLCGNTGPLLACTGKCHRSFHPECLGMLDFPVNSWKCDQCRWDQERTEECYLCQGGEEFLRKCNTVKCGSFYHPRCLKAFPVYVFGANNLTFSCGRHHCYYCHLGFPEGIAAGKSAAEIIAEIANPEEGVMESDKEIRLRHNTFGNMYCKEEYPLTKEESYVFKVKYHPPAEGEGPAAEEEGAPPEQARKRAKKVKDLRDVLLFRCSQCPFTCCQQCAVHVKPTDRKALLDTMQEDSDENAESGALSACWVCQKAGGDGEEKDLGQESMEEKKEDEEQVTHEIKVESGGDTKEDGQQSLEGPTGDVQAVAPESASPEPAEKASPEAGQAGDI